MSGWLDNPTLRVLEAGLDGSSLRQKVLSNNIANVDTPDFKRSDVDFQQILGEALGEPRTKLPLKVTSTQHLQSASGSSKLGVIRDGNSTFRNDGNNVDIDKEMSNVAENGIYYNSVTQALTSQLGHLRMVIEGK